MSAEWPDELAIVTGRHAPRLSENGRALADALADRGVETAPVMWDDPSVRWGRYDGVLIRSCWEYPEDRARFRTLLDELSGTDVPVCNPLRALRWNLHKSYLLDLADEGVRIPPTAALDRGTDTSLAAVLRERGWTDAVVKPAVGAMSADVRRVSMEEAVRTAEPAETGERAEPAEPGETAETTETSKTTTSAESAGSDRTTPWFADLLADHDVIVQAFVPEIVDGERSIVYFGGSYSHAWNSLPAESVTEFDDIDAGYEPSTAIREQADDVIRAAREILGVEPSEVPYARIDYVERGSELVLMELELIEPYLGLDRGAGAIGRFCDAVLAYFGDRIAGDRGPRN